MPKTAIIHARTETALKANVEKIFRTLGMTTTEAVNIFFKQVKLRRGLPFQVEIPNRATLKAFKNSEEGRGLTESKNAQDMFDKLGI